MSNTLKYEIKITDSQGTVLVNDWTTLPEVAKLIIDHSAPQPTACEVCHIRLSDPDSNICNQCKADIAKEHNDTDAEDDIRADRVEENE